MTKAEQKKMEKAAKQAFIKNAFGCVLDAVFEGSGRISSSPQIRVMMKNGSRYIRFHRYGDDFNIQIYASGDVDIEFMEFCHDTRKYRVFEYDGDMEVQAAFLEQFWQDMRMVITEFLEHADWHTILDFMPPDGDHWQEAFIDSLEPAVNTEEPLRWNPEWVSKYTDDEEDSVG